MKRVLEPELMLDQEQCLEFYRSVPDIVLSEKLRFLPETISGTVGELGCGPAVFTKMLLEKFPSISIDAYDGSDQMLRLAKMHIDDQDRINIINELIENIDKKYDMIISLNTLHHIHDPLIFWNTVKRMSTNHTKILVTDLMRPNDEESVYRIVDQVLGQSNENSLFKEDFVNSLKASFTKEEVEEQVKELKCSVEISQHLGIDYLVIKNYV
jgi:trans-aconitate methyltransferase